MAEYIEREALDKLIESRKVRGDCKFCAKYERSIANGINRKGSHLYCWEQLKLPTVDVVPVVRCKDCIYFQDRYIELPDGSKRPYEKGENIVPISVGINVGSYCKRIDYAIVHGQRDGEPSVDETRLWANPDDYCSRAESKGKQHL